MANFRSFRKSARPLVLFVFLLAAVAFIVGAVRQTSLGGPFSLINRAFESFGSVPRTIKEWTFDKTKAKGNVIDNWKAIGINPYTVENGILHGVLADTPEARKTGTELVNNSVNAKLDSDIVAIKLRFALSVPELASYPVYTPEFLYQTDKNKSTWHGPLQFTVVADGQLREYTIPLRVNVLPSDPREGMLPPGTRIERIKFHLPGVPFNSMFAIDWIRLVTIPPLPTPPNPETSKLPDLAALDGTISVSPATPAIGGYEVKAKLIIQNIGQSNAKPVHYEYKLTDHWTSSANPDSTCTLGTVLKPGGSCLSSYIFGYTTTGTKTLIAVLDPDNELKELDETNNKASVSFVVAPPPISFPN